MPLTRLTHPLSQVLRRVDPDRRLGVYRLWTFWAEEVGETIAARAQPVVVRGGVLTVAVQGPSWMQELQFLKEQIRERLNARLGQAAISDIYFVPGSRPPMEPTQAEATAGADDPEMAAPIEMPALRDKALAEVFTRVARAHHRRRRPAAPTRRPVS